MGDFILRLLLALSFIAYSLLALWWISWQLVNLVSW